MFLERIFQVASTGGVHAFLLAPSEGNFVVSSWSIQGEQSLGRKRLAGNRESCHLRTLFEHLPEFFRYLLDQVRSSMKLSRSRLKEFDTPGAIAFSGDEGLMRVDSRIEIYLSWGHHSRRWRAEWPLLDSTDGHF